MAYKRSWSRAVAETPEHASDRKNRPHGGLHSMHRADLQQKARAPLMGVAYTVQRAAGSLNALTVGQPALLAAGLDAECSLQDLHPLVLAQVKVARNAAARIQQDLDFEKLATRLVAGLEEPQVLAGEGVMQHAQLPSPAWRAPSPRIMPPACQTDQAQAVER